MLTQVEMAQSIYDNGGHCCQGEWWSCDDCPVSKECGAALDNHSLLVACLAAAEEFLHGPDGKAQSYLSTKTRRKPAFKRLSSRKTYRPEESAWDKSVKEADDFWDFHGSDVRL